MGVVVFGVEMEAHTGEWEWHIGTGPSSLPQKPTPVLKHSHQQIDDVNLVLKY